MRSLKFQRSVSDFQRLPQSGGLAAPCLAPRPRMKRLALRLAFIPLSNYYYALAKRDAAAYEKAAYGGCQMHERVT